MHLAAADSFRRHDDRPALAGRLGALGLPPDYVLYVGNFRPHKNLPRLLEAMALMSRRNSATALVIAGGVERGLHGLTPETVAQLAVTLGIEDRVIQVGKVSDETLIDLYNGAAVAAIPSLYEGFGLPALEAMACGTAVVASRTGALEELVDGAGLLVDPRDSTSISEALFSVLSDSARRQSLQQASLKRAREFSWQESARQLLAAIESAAS
jgi:glycosyltransferase involved in cell wall biosynthesis